MAQRPVGKRGADRPTFPPERLLILLGAPLQQPRAHLADHVSDDLLVTRALRPQKLDVTADRGEAVLALACN